MYYRIRITPKVSWEKYNFEDGHEREIKVCTKYNFLVVCGIPDMRDMVGFF